MIADKCECWVKYPNKSYKCKNGKWRCADYYPDYISRQGKQHCKRRECEYYGCCI